MPNLANKPKIALKKPEHEKEESAKVAGKSASLKANNAIKKAKVDTAEEDEDSEEEDEIIAASLKKKEASGNNGKFIVLAIVVVVLVVAVFLLFGGKKEKPKEDVPPDGQETEQPMDEETPGDAGTTEEEEPGKADIAGVGTQDFTGNTTMESDTPLTNPDAYVKDIYNLTTRVDYTVSEIQEAADFVSYTKHRGTWGGGLELYWLDAQYKGRQYAVQVPFKYYKELDDSGIVPVKMEVLRITGASEGDNRTVISYMCLDEETLLGILESQGLLE